MRFPAIYQALLKELLASPHTELNQRTGVAVKILPSGCSFVLDLSDGILPTMGYRKAYPFVAGAELAWFLSGKKDVTWLNKYAPRIWSKFVEPNTTYINNAYGYRWRHHFRRDQLIDAVNALNNNPTDRRIYIGAWDPELDLASKGKNVPCPVGFSVYIIDGTLHMSVFLRSLDTFVGLPYDVMDFALLLHAFAMQTHRSPGTLRVTAAHVHLYEKHWEMAETVQTQECIEPQFEMPGYSITDITARPDDFVRILKNETTVHSWPKYAPIPEVIE